MIEASPETRKNVQKDCDAINQTRRRKVQETLTKWCVGVVVVGSIVGICCLIWGPENVFGVIGVILALVVLGALQGARR